MNLLEKCNNCKLKECIECEYTWSDLKETIEHLQKNNKDKKTYEFGLIVGTKRERDWWQNKIREKIEEIKSRMNDDCLALHEFQREAKIDVLYDLLKEE